MQTDNTSSPWIVPNNDDGVLLYYNNGTTFGVQQQNSHSIDTREFN